MFCCQGQKPTISRLGWQPGCLLLLPGSLRAAHQLTSCLCHLPKPARDLCVTSHLAGELRLPATPCPSPATHHTSQRCHKIWFTRPSSAKACPKPCPHFSLSLRPWTTLCQQPLLLLLQQMLVAASLCGVADLGSSKQLYHLPFSSSRAISAHLSIPWGLTLHAGLE